MKLYVIFGVCKAEYGSENLEALDCCDEYTMDENPSYMEEKLKKHKSNSIFDFVDVVTFKLDENEIMSQIIPDKREIKLIAEKRES